MADLRAEWAASGRALTDADIIRQLGWHPDLAVPPCPPINPTPKPESFKAPRKPPATRRDRIFAAMKKEQLAKSIAIVTQPEPPQPQPGDFPLDLLGACKKPGTCYPSNTQRIAVGDQLSYSVITAAWGSGFHLAWVRSNDPNKAAIVQAFYDKWLSPADQH